jgi:cell wall-associated NlpC family hydrolase
LSVHRQGQRLRALFCFTLILFIMAGIFAGTAEARTLRERKIDHARHIVINQAGDPYVYGADGPDAFDCSGLMYYAYRKAGLEVPRTASDQYQHARHIPRDKTVRGDFLFFHDSGGHVYHVAMMAGRVNGHIIMWHAPHTGTVVHRARPWTGMYYSGTLRLQR